MAKTDSITAEQARAVLAYDAETGKFFRPSGAQAGSLMKAGYVEISVCGARFYGHRLAWLMHHGVHPSGHIDHINGNKADNRIANLRDGPRCINMQNLKRARADSKSGLLGVSWSKAAGKWTARIKIGGKYVHLGLFLDERAAYEAYIDAKRAHQPGCTI
jgi:HNH endonuclease